MPGENQRPDPYEPFIRFYKDGGYVGAPNSDKNIADDQTLYLSSQGFALGGEVLPVTGTPAINGVNEIDRIRRLLEMASPGFQPFDFGSADGGTGAAVGSVGDNGGIAGIGETYARGGPVTAADELATGYVGQYYAEGGKVGALRAALKVANQIFEGLTHADAYERFHASPLRGGTFEEGFLTPQGTFLDRESAMSYARRQKLVDPNEAAGSDELWSEMMPEIRETLRRQGGYARGGYLTRSCR